MKQHQKNPDKIGELKQKISRSHEVKDLVKSSIEELGMNGQSILSVKQIIDKVQDEHQQDVSKRLVMGVLKRDLNLSFKKAKKIAPQANS